FKAHNVVKVVCKILHTEFRVVLPEFLFYSHGPSLARFRLQRRIPGEAGKSTVCLIESRLFDPFAVENAESRLAPEVSALQKRQRSSYARHHARSKNRV